MANINGVDPPVLNDQDYVDKIIDSFTAVDNHDHTPGKGVALAAGSLAAGSVTNTDISPSAAIDRSKLASGAASAVVINNASGVMTDEATLAKVRGGTGADNSSVTFPATGVIVTEAGTSALTNKTYDADGAGNVLSNIDDGNIKTGAGIARTKLASGSASHVIVNDVSGVMTSEAQLAITRGGTGQSTANAAFGALAPTSAKGDLISFSTVNAKLAVGSNDDGLVADSGQTVGLRWSRVDGSNMVRNVGLVTTVNANALTINLAQKDGNDGTAANPVCIGFRDATAANGLYVQRKVTSSLSMVVTSGATLGHPSSSTTQYIYVYAIDNAGTVELAVSGILFDEGSPQTTTAMSNGADVPNVLYSTTARTGVGIRLIGRLKSAQSTAGLWAANMSEISLVPFPDPGVPMLALKGAALTGTIGSSFAASTTINWDTTSIDTHIGYSGGSYTIPVAGYYTVSGQVLMASTEAANNFAALAVAVGGAEQFTGIVRQWAASITNTAVTVHTPPMKLAKGDVVTTRLYSNAAAAAFDSDATLNFLGIKFEGPLFVGF